MSDAAFKTASYPAYTTDQLRAMLANTECVRHQIYRDAVAIEIARREKRDAGDVSVMTPGERLRLARAN